MEKHFNYNKNLKGFARNHRKEGTKAEAVLWKYVLSRKQMRGLTFNRQFASGNFIFDFFCRKAKLVIEVDGITHQFEENVPRDRAKELYITKQGLELLRIDDNEVLSELEGTSQMTSNWLEQKDF